jgi:hypothetical protein
VLERLAIEDVVGGLVVRLVGGQPIPGVVVALVKCDALGLRFEDALADLRAGVVTVEIVDLR